MKKRKPYITRRDLEKLKALIELYRGTYEPYLERLEAELNGAHVIDSRDVPGNVVTMNSVVKIQDLETNEQKTIVLVFPEKAGVQGKAVSILAPIGLALIGLREGDVLEWVLPSVTIKIQIVEIVYQPERVGNFNL